MSYSEEQTRRCINEARRTIARADVMSAHQAEGESEATRDDNVISDNRKAALARPVESINTKHRRELAERDAEWARERRRADREEQLLEARLMAAVDQRVAAMRGEIESLRGEVLSVAQATSKAVESIVNSLDDLRDAARAPLVAADAHVKQTLERIEKMIGDLGGCVVDLPNPIARRVN